MSILLAIESSGDGGGAAVLKNGALAAEVSVPAPRTHGAQLLVCVDRALSQAGTTRAQISAVAVNCGPGSYTGLRIGLATAAAIGHALDRPVIGVPCFDAMAQQFCTSRKLADAELWPVLDARREQVMTARFNIQGGKLSRAGEDQLLSPEALCEAAADKAIVFGTGLPAYPGKWDQSRIRADSSEFVLSAASIGLQAWQMLAGGDPGQWPRKPVEPRYFRSVTARTIEERTR